MHDFLFMPVHKPDYASVSHSSPSILEMLQSSFRLQGCWRQMINTMSLLLSIYEEKQINAEEKEKHTENNTLKKSLLSSFMLFLDFLNFSPDTSSIKIHGIFHSSPGILQI